VATALCILGALTGQGTSAATVGLTDTTVSAATTAVPSGGASPKGGVGAVPAPGNLLLGSPYGPFYGVPPATRPFSATAFLHGLSPRPSTVAGADSALAATLENAKTAAAAAEERVRVTALAWEDERTTADALARHVAEVERFIHASTGERVTSSPPTAPLQPGAGPRVARTTPWSPTSTFRPPGSRTSRTW
jgi:hypothetical protein